LPAYSISPGTSSFTGVPPAVTMTVGATKTSPDSVTQSNWPSARRVTDSTGVDVRISAPNFSACAWNLVASSWPRTCSNPM